MEFQTFLKLSPLQLVLPHLPICKHESAPKCFHGHFLNDLIRFHSLTRYLLKPYFYLQCRPFPCTATRQTEAAVLRRFHQVCPFLQLIHGDEIS